ncbi:MAG: CoA transferase, partial [Sphingomonas sp.]
MPTLPLAGLRVLDISQVMAGPFCCMLLGDMGADVIKIEPPHTGDSTRHSMGFRLKGEDSPGFLALNRNKRSITLNLKDEADREVLYALVKTADIVVENARPGVSQRLGIDYETLSAINPGLVYASISGFGQTGPWAQRPGFDLIAQAMSGVLSSNGFPGMEPAKNSIAVADLGAGLFSVYGILSAIIGRQTSGKGQYIDASLLEAALGLSIWETTELWGTGKPPTPIGSANRMSAPYQAVLASDGWFVMAAGNDALFQKLCAALELPELAADPRFATNPLRCASHEALKVLLEQRLASAPAAHWQALLMRHDIPTGAYNDLAAVVADPQVHAREILVTVQTQSGRSLTVAGSPVHVGAHRTPARHQPPRLDQDRQAILEELREAAALQGCSP